MYLKHWSWSGGCENAIRSLAASVSKGTSTSDDSLKARLDKKEVPVEHVRGYQCQNYERKLEKNSVKILLGDARSRRREEGDAKVRRESGDFESS